MFYGRHFYYLLSMLYGGVWWALYIYFLVTDTFTNIHNHEEMSYECIHGTYACTHTHDKVYVYNFQKCNNLRRMRVKFFVLSYRCKCLSLYPYTYIRSCRPFVYLQANYTLYNTHSYIYRQSSADINISRTALKYFVVVLRWWHIKKKKLNAKYPPTFAFRCVQNC